MTLKKLATFKKHIKLTAVAKDAGMSEVTIRSRIDRGAPELTPDESKKIETVLKKLASQIKGD